MSDFLLLLVGYVQVFFVLLGLLLDSLQDFTDVGTSVRVYLRVVLLQQTMSSHQSVLLRVCLQLLVYPIVVRLVTCLPRYYVHNHMLQRLIFLIRLLPSRNLYLHKNSTRWTVKICLHGSSQEFDAESHVKDFRWVELFKIADDSPRDKQYVCIEYDLRPGSNWTTGMQA